VRYLYQPSKIFADESNVLQTNDISTLDAGAKAYLNALKGRFTLSAEAIYRSVLNKDLIDPSWRWLIWLAAACMFLAASFGRREQRFQVNPSHFAERHGLVIIVAIGESVVSLGTGVGATPLGWELIGVVVLGFALCAALWWTYFGGDDELGERALTKAAPERRLRLAVLAYSYVHLGMLFGIVAIASGLQAAIAALGAPVSPFHAWTLAGGIALYLASDKLFRYMLSIGTTRFRSGAAVLSLAAAPLGWRLGGAIEIGALVTLLVLMLAAESWTMKPAHVR